jgi:predicted amidophosphoribosyltransferase
MDYGQIILLALLLPGILIVLFVVIAVLPRALRDEKRMASNVCVQCGCALGNSTNQCPQCGAPARRQR